jgi:hypothetical protein
VQCGEIPTQSTATLRPFNVPKLSRFYSAGTRPLEGSALPRTRQQTYVALTSRWISTIPLQIPLV